MAPPLNPTDRTRAAEFAQQLQEDAESLQIALREEDSERLAVAWQRCSGVVDQLAGVLGREPGRDGPDAVAAVSDPSPGSRLGRATGVEGSGFTEVSEQTPGTSPRGA
jgi:hypothetical protein